MDIARTRISRYKISLLLRQLIPMYYYVESVFYNKYLKMQWLSSSLINHVFWLKIDLYVQTGCKPSFLQEIVPQKVNTL